MAFSIHEKQKIRSRTSIYHSLRGLERGIQLAPAMHVQAPMLPDWQMSVTAASLPTRWLARSSKAESPQERRTPLEWERSVPACESVGRSQVNEIQKVVRS